VVAERPSDSKTEEPTPQRLVEARRRGEIVVSRELLSAFTLVVVFVALVLGARTWIGRLVAYLHRAWGDAASAANLVQAGREALYAAVDGLAIPLGFGVGTALVVGLVQTRGWFSTRPLQFDLRRVWPSTGRRFGAVAETSKALLKATVVAMLAWWTLRPALPDVAHLFGASAGSTLVALGALAEKLSLRLVLAVVAFAAADYLWRRHQLMKALRMSRDEVRREHKEREGDPLFKAERQRLHRELLQQNDQVRRAKLVVVDSSHLAVVLDYAPDETQAPVVVAKGEGLVASKMVTVARESGVGVFQDAVLARRLLDVEEGSEIPEALYQPVAEAMAGEDASHLPAISGH
jgi:type III secretion protein U